jgi:ABC-type polysaccharide transport system permease subunit
LVASLAYVAACVYDRLVSGLADPFLIVRDVHFGYYHRAALAAWIGGAAALVAYRSLDGAERIDRLVRALVPTILPVVVLVAIATYVFP